MLNFESENILANAKKIKLCHSCDGQVEQRLYISLDLLSCGGSMVGRIWILNAILYLCYVYIVVVNEFSAYANIQQIDAICILKYYFIK